MIGEKIDELSAKITGTRVIPAEGGNVKVEVSFVGTGKFLGVEAMEMGTYQSVMTPAGVLNGEGHGLAMSSDGDALTWTGHGVGRPMGKGMAASWRYSLVIRTASSCWARLNGVLAIGEWEVDEAGNGKAQVWEWK
ncbi:MAG: hypothetical protein HY736_07510 [Verrucomicrobia bacterium]|nr:hypothetical protein [Verrucomicrobiota bacterium]